MQVSLTQSPFAPTTPDFAHGRPHFRPDLAPLTDAGMRTSSVAAGIVAVVAHTHRLLVERQRLLEERRGLLIDHRRLLEEGLRLGDGRAARSNAS